MRAADDVATHRAMLNAWENGDIDTLRKMHRIGKVELPDDQVRDKFNHADDFGITGNKNPVNQQKFREAIAEHAIDPDTKVIEGKYVRGDDRDHTVTHLYNPKTGNNVIVKDREFVSGWKLNKVQQKRMEKDGILGGS